MPPIARSPVDAQFIGITLNAYDQYYYLARHRSAAENLPANRFTSEPDAPGPVSPLYALTGEVQEKTPLPGILADHLPRILSAFLLPLILFAVFRLCFPRPRERRWSLWSSPCSASAS